MPCSNVGIRFGDCAEILPTLEQCSVDAVVTDPPYGLVEPRSGGDGSGQQFAPRTEEMKQKRKSGFMGKKWDSEVPGIEIWKEVLRVLKPGGYALIMGGSRTYHRLTCAVEDGGFEIRDCIMWLYCTGFPKSKSCLKPAYEPIVLARKFGKKKQPLRIDDCRIEGVPWKPHKATGLSNVKFFLKEKTAVIEKTPNELGRYPSNVIHDGSEEVMEDLSSAARFFYCAKPSPAERGKHNDHPTVKPLALMRYLIKMICPEGGVVLDPYLGSGTTAVAAIMENRKCIGIESDPDYFEIAKTRISQYRSQK